MRLIKSLFFFLCIGIFFISSKSYGTSFNVLPGDEVYNLLDELEAVGALNSQIWGIKPFTEEEVARLLWEARRHADLLNPYLKKRLEENWIRFRYIWSRNQSFIKPLEDPYLFYIYSHDAPSLENFQGRNLQKDNFFLGFQTKIYASPHLLFHDQIEYKNRDSSQDIRFMSLYGKTELKGISIEAGKDSFWWGVGYTGNLLFSLNPPPFKRLVKIENEKPFLLPWIFTYLGPFKFSLALAELEADRTVPHPLLIGMKVNFKPHPRLEIGLTRSILCGGEGRRLSLTKILFGTGENVSGSPDNSEGDQKAGFEIRLRPINHLILYIEDAGEDEAGHLPSKHSYILGLFAADIFSRWNFRFEYTRITKWWYHHHVYKTGYTYEGWIIGYYTDRVVKNYFTELSFDISSDWRLKVNYNLEKRYNSTDQFLYDLSRYQGGIIGYLHLGKIPLRTSLFYRYYDFSKSAPYNDGYQIILENRIKF